MHVTDQQVCCVLNCYNLSKWLEEMSCDKTHKPVASMPGALCHSTLYTVMVMKHHPSVPMQATVPVLWLMPALQLLLLLFFTTVAVSHWIYSWVLLVPCLITGALRLQICGSVAC